MADRCPRVLLAFSRGKDSIASWIKLRDAGGFEEIIPYYMYPIPGLEFEEESLAYYERAFGAPIYRVPNPSLYRMLNEFIFQPPERCAIIEAANFPRVTKEQMVDYVRASKKLPMDTFEAIGLRVSDSMTRRASLSRYGPITESRKKFYPIWDMNKAALIETLQRSGIKLPREYRYMSSSFDGLTYRYLKPVKEHFPRDYQRILEWFPLADLAIFRQENLRKTV